jgi:hypothetical protein
MDPSNRLFGHYLRYRMDMQKSMAEQHNGQPEVKKVAGIGAAIGKLLRNMVGYQKYPATHMERGVLKGETRWSLIPLPVRNWRLVPDYNSLSRAVGQLSIASSPVHERISVRCTARCTPLARTKRNQQDLIGTARLRPA